MVHPAGIEPTTFGFGDNRTQIPSTYIQTTYKSQNFQLVLKLIVIFVKTNPLSNPSLIFTPYGHPSQGRV